MKYPHLIYSFLFLLVFGGCCKVDDSPLRLTATDLELLANEVGDTIRLKDVATDSVYTYVVDSVDVSLQPNFNGLIFTAEKPKCSPKEREIEVGKVTFSSKGGYKFARSESGTFYFDLKFKDIQELSNISFTIDVGFELDFIKFHNEVIFNNRMYKNVYEVLSSFPSNPEKYIRVLISNVNGLVYIDEHVTSNKLLVGIE